MPITYHLANEEDVGPTPVSACNLAAFVEVVESEVVMKVLITFDDRIPILVDLLLGKISFTPGSQRQ